jgi:HK97 family phage prohead protease
MSEETLTLHREVSVEIAEGDGRTLVSRLVPYNEVATVSDGGPPYQEMFVPGAFQRQKGAAHRIKAFLNFRHGQGLSDQIGFAKSVEERADGLHGELRVLDGNDGDKALQLVREGMLDKLSIEFSVPPGGTRVVDGVVQRVRAHLKGVALVPRGAYAGAAVLAVRELDEDTEHEDDPSAELMQGLRYSVAEVEALERVGITVPADARPLERAFTDAPWDGSPSRWPDAASYCRACAVDDNASGSEKSKAQCHLPIREPDGTYNLNAIRAALARLDQTQMMMAKAPVRDRLERLLAQGNAASA